MKQKVLTRIEGLTDFYKAEEENQMHQFKLCEIEEMKLRKFQKDMKEEGIDYMKFEYKRDPPVLDYADEK